LLAWSAAFRELCKKGDVWPEAARKLWLQILEDSFKLIYKDKADETSKPTEWK
jgi:hypothetical protein